MSRIAGCAGWVRLAIACGVACGASPLAAQAPRLPQLFGAPSPAPSPAAAPRYDDLGRETPRGTVRGFLAAARGGRFDLAAAYLRSRPGAEAGSEPAPAPALVARHLAVVLERRLPIDLDTLSDEPEGYRDDGLGADRERIGTIRTASGVADIMLDRVTGVASGPIWLVATRTVSQAGPLYQEFGDGRLGELLSPVFFEVYFLGLALWQWLGLGLVLLAAAAVAWGARRSGIRLALWLARRTSSPVDDQLIGVLREPIGALIFVVLGALLCRLLSLPLPALALVDAVAKAAFILVLTWILIRALDALAGPAELRLVAGGHSAARSLVPLARRTVQALVIVAAIAAFLQAFGVNAAGIVAGLGIGGLAVALGAQKTLENFFGGLSLALDQPVRVGDSCRFGDQVGTVEDIGLRSTRIRTLDRTVVTVPNSQFSNLMLENLSRRERTRLVATLGLRHETPLEQIRAVLAALRALLAAHPEVDPVPTSVHLAAVGPYALEVRIEAFLVLPDRDRFNAVREELLLAVLTAVREQGCELALPAQRLVFAPDAAPGREPGGEPG